MNSEDVWPWWEDYNKSVREIAARGYGSGDVLSPAVCALLEDVDAAFARSDPPPGWPDPRLLDAEPGEDAYERSSHPEKFRIVATRAEAWATVLLGRGWAREGSSARWALPPMETGGRDTVLTPSADGAVPLVLTLHEAVSAENIVTVSISAGDPAVRLSDVPDCGCDGCDDGSDSLLREIDRWVLSVVDGSLEVEVSAASQSARNSFGWHGGSPVQGFLEATAFTAAPWSEDWTARPLSTPR